MTKRLIILLASLVLVVPLLFYGCSGDDGSNGAQGAKGDTGATGATGPVTNTNESCMVCHTTGRIADITDGATGVHFAPANSLPTLTVDNVVVSDNGAGGLVVNFRVKIDNNAPYTKLDNTSSYFFAADLVPAGTVAAALDGMPQSTDQFERWAFERTGTFATTGLGVRNYAFGTFDNTNAATGNYKYTFATPLGSTTPYDNAVHFSAADIQRVYVRIAGTPSGTYTGGVGFVDFTIKGTAPTFAVDNANIGYLKRQFVTIEACQKCHGPKNQVMDHASSYMDINGCVICHSPITNANNGGGSATATPTGPLTTKFFMVDLWLGKMIHRIHDGIGSTLTNKPQADATYPQDIRLCVVCHSNPSGKNLGAGDNTANWKNHPTAAYCGTCHLGFPNTSHNGGAHGGGTSLTSSCTGCHPADGTGSGGSVTQAHDTSPFAVLHPNTKNQPEFNVTLTLTPSKPFYVAGDNILIKAVLTKQADNTAVPTAVYTNPQGLKGIADNALLSASVAVTGPRALPKPILNLPKNPTTGAVPQSANLFIGSKLLDNTVNSRVLTDNTAFKYNLTIPAGLKAGVYGVRVRFGDYGYVSDNNYKIESVKFQTIRIGDNTTADLKVAGDGCTACHGVGDFLDAHDARHAVVFDTDECITCHDYSGGHAAVLANRVHAIHSSNTLGDMLNTQIMQTTSGGWITGPTGTPNLIDVDWSEVGYPQNIGQTATLRANCVTCHTSGNTSYRSVVHEVSCLGCHGDNIYTGGASNHMLQSGGDWPLVK